MSPLDTRILHVFYLLNYLYFIFLFFPNYKLEIIVYKSEKYQTYFTHRFIYKKKKDGKVIYIFKGDAFRSFDAPVSSESILGKILVIEKGGLCIELNSVKGRLQSWLFFFLFYVRFLFKDFTLIITFWSKNEKVSAEFCPQNKPQ